MKKLIKCEEKIINYVLKKSGFNTLKSNDFIIINDILEEEIIIDNLRILNERIIKDFSIKFIPETGKKSKRIEVKNIDIKKEKYCLMICETAITIIIYGISSLKEASGKMNLMIRR